MRLRRRHGSPLERTTRQLLGRCRRRRRAARPSTRPDGRRPAASGDNRRRGCCVTQPRGGEARVSVPPPPGPLPVPPAPVPLPAVAAPEVERAAGAGDLGGGKRRGTRDLRRRSDDRRRLGLLGRRALRLSSSLRLRRGLRRRRDGGGGGGCSRLKVFSCSTAWLTDAHVEPGEDDERRARACTATTAAIALAWSGRSAVPLIARHASVLDPTNAFRRRSLPAAIRAPPRRP